MCYNCATIVCFALYKAFYLFLFKLNKNAINYLDLFFTACLILYKPIGNTINHAELAEKPQRRGQKTRLTDADRRQLAWCHGS